MSRTAAFSSNPNALKALFAQETGDTLVPAVSFTYNSTELTSVNIRLVANFTHRFQYLTADTCTITDLRTNISSSRTYNSNDDFVKGIINSGEDDELYYGIISTVNGTLPSGAMFLFLPFQLTLPDDVAESIPKAKIQMFDVTQHLTPIIRSIFEPPKVSLYIMLYSDTNTTPVVMDEFYLSVINYNAQSIDGELSIESYISEPFPAHSFIPSIFPGVF